MEDHDRWKWNHTSKNVRPSRTRLFSAFRGNNKVSGIQDNDFDLDTDVGYILNQKYQCQVRGTQMSGKALVDEQAAGQQVVGSIWHAVVHNDQDQVEQLLQSNPRCVYDRDAVGATPMLCAFLLGNFELGMWMIRQRPEICDDIYEPSQLYEGENALHIAIINRRDDVVRFLVERCPELLCGRATGVFFQLAKPGQPKKQCYFGEYPLSFACATQNSNCVRYLIAQGANMYARDTHGNTCLHIIIMKGSRTMANLIDEIDDQVVSATDAEHNTFSSSAGSPMARAEAIPGLFIKEEWREAKQSLWMLANNDELTPFCLAAYMGAPDMFAYLVNKRVLKLWEYGPVQCNAYSLEDMDGLLERLKAIDNPLHRPSKHNALEIIVGKQHMKLMNTKKVIELLDRKWERFAKKRLYHKIAAIFIYIILFTMAIVLRDYRLDKSLVEQYSHHIATWIVVEMTCEILVFLGAMYKMVNELVELCRHGCSKMYVSSVGFARNENVIAMSFCILQLSSVLCRVLEAYQAERVLWTFMTYLLWVYLTLLFMAFRAFGPFIVMIKRMILGDIMRFAVIGIFVLASFTTVFFCLLDIESNDDSRLFERISLAGSIATDLYGQMISGDVRFDRTIADLHINKDFVWLYYINVFLFSIIMCVMLLNLLIAMMGNTYDRITDRAETEWRLVFAQIIFFLEDEMSTRDLLRMKKDDCKEKYWVEINGRSYLSVEEVNPLWNTPDEDEVDSWLKHFDVDEDSVLDKGEVKRLVAMLRKKAQEDNNRRSESDRKRRPSTITYGQERSPLNIGKEIKQFGALPMTSPRRHERPSLSLGMGLDHQQEHLPNKMLSAPNTMSPKMRPLDENKQNTSTTLTDKMAEEQVQAKAPSTYQSSLEHAPLLSSRSSEKPAVITKSKQ